MDHRAETLTRITNVAQSRYAMQRNIHEALCHATMHALNHGDVTLFNKIMDAAGKACDRRAVIDWCAAHSLAKWNRNIASFELNKGRRTALGNAHIGINELLDQTPWYEFGKEKKDLVREFDVIAKLQAVVRGYDNAKDDGKPTANDWAIGAVAALLGRLEASASEVAAEAV